MSATPAQVRYNCESRLYVVQYISACKAAVEMLPKRDEHRLRAFPRGCTSRMHRTSSTPQELNSTEEPDEHSLPYCVLGGTGGLSVGCSVEMQWKMCAGSPFIWWYGVLEHLRQQDDGTAMATVVFPHFPETSQFYRQNVQIGDGAARPGAFGGFTGGVRTLSQVEENVCLQFMPQAIRQLSNLPV